MNEHVAVDTNIVLYALNDADPAKKRTAVDIVRRYPVLSSQSFTEVINVCRRKWKYDKSKQIDVGEFLLANSRLIPTSEGVIRSAHHLIASYDFQYFDSLIIAAALQTGCNILYSEDMHHQLLVEKQLRIINPFF